MGALQGDLERGWGHRGQGVISFCGTCSTCDPLERKEPRMCNCLRIMTTPTVLLLLIYSLCCFRHNKSGVFSVRYPPRGATTQQRLTLCLFNHYLLSSFSLDTPTCLCVCPTDFVDGFAPIGSCGIWLCSGGWNCFLPCFGLAFCWGRLRYCLWRRRQCGW